MSDPLPIRTERLIIRPFSIDDLDDLLDLQSRPDVVRYLPYGVRDRDEVRKALDTKLRQGVWPPKEDDALCVAVVLPETGKVIGEVVLFQRSTEHRLGEVGYVFHPDHGGRGYATEAARAVLRIGFEDFGLYRIIARLDARNTPSANVVERLGMRREAHFVRNEFWKGEWTDELVYAMLDTEWKNGSTPIRDPQHDAGDSVTDTPREVFLKLVHGVCDERWADVLDLYAEETHVSHPFHPVSAPPLLSREELREHFSGGPQPYQGPTLRRRPTRINIHETTDPEVIVAEFQYEGVVVETGEPFTIPGVFVMRVRDGKIVESRDYLDHLRSAAARGMLTEVLQAIGEHHSTSPDSGTPDSPESIGGREGRSRDEGGLGDAGGDPGAEEFDLGGGAR